MRVDSNLVLTFTGATSGRDVVVSGLLRGDTIFVYSLSLVPEEIPVLHYSFVKVRGP